MAYYLQELVQAVFVQHGDAEFLGFRELAAGFGARDHVIRLLRHRTGHFRARRFEHFLRGIARERRQRARQHDRLAGQHALRAFGAGGPSGHVTLPGARNCSITVRLCSSAKN